MERPNLKNEGDINLTEARIKWVDSLSAETRLMLEEDADCFLHQALSTPCLELLSACEGPYLITGDGRKILDFHGNNLHQVGYANPRVLDALQKQLGSLTFSPRRYTNAAAVALAKRLCSLVPGLNRVLLAPGGSEANSMALKLARIVTGKYKVVSMWGSFHGAGMDTLSVGGDPTFHRNMGPMMPGVIHVPPPESYRPSRNDDPDQNDYVEHIRYVFEHEGDIGALMAETIRNTDVEIPSLHFWKNIRTLCDEYGVLLILDEIPTALGRTGTFFAFEQYGIVPDMVTIGKGLGAGIIPIAALLTRDEYNIAPEYSIGHFTHEKSPLGSAVALAVLDFIQQEGLVQQAREMGQHVRDKLNNMKERFPVIGDVRGTGLLWALDLVSDPQLKTRNPDLAEKVMYSCLEHGLGFKVSKGNVIGLSPALIITQEEMDQALSILENAFITLTSGL
jgi:4-aminobutyrate aminotransferase